MSMDEEFLNLINRQEEEEQAAAQKEALEKQAIEGVEAGILHIHGQTLTFHEKRLFEEQVRLKLPDDFAIMNPELAALKYPSQWRPEPLFSNTAGSISLGLNHTQVVVSDDNIAEFTQSMQQALKRLQSSAQFMEDGVKSIHGRNVGYLEFCSQALDCEIYNLMFFTEFAGTSLMGSFNCIETEMELWQPIAKGILESLEIVKSTEFTPEAE